MTGMEQAGKSRARMIAAGLIVIVGLVSSAVADTRPTYDKRIEEAAISRLVPKLGAMRGSLELGANLDLPAFSNQRNSRNNAADAPAASPGSRSSGSLLFF